MKNHTTNLPVISHSSLSDFELLMLDDIADYLNIDSSEIVIAGDEDESDYSVICPKGEVESCPSIKLALAILNSCLRENER